MTELDAKMEAFWNKRFSKVYSKKVHRQEKQGDGSGRREDARLHTEKRVPKHFKINTETLARLFVLSMMP